MMGKNVTGWVSGLLLAAVAVYMGVNIVSALTQPFKTARVERLAISDSIAVEGYFVRKETLITSDSAVFTVTAAQGEKIGKGQAVALTFDSPEAMEAYAQAESLTARLELLQETQGLTCDRLDSLISENLTAVNQTALSGRQNAAAKHIARLKALVFSRDCVYNNTIEPQAEIALLQEAVSEIQVTATELPAPVSGLYRRETDGYEGVLSPEGLSGFTPESFDAITPAAISGSSMGTLVSGTDWFFLTVTDSESAEKLEQTVTLKIDGFEVDMTVCHVGSAGGDRSVVVLKSGRLMAQTLSMRRSEAELIMNTRSGLEVPASALHLEASEKPYVFVVEGAKARIKYVEIITQTQNGYLVTEDVSSTHNLWAGDEIVTAGRGLYDGKVVE